MSATTHETTRLAYDDSGSGQPVVFLHGLTFDRRTWHPIVERMGDSVRSVAIDLPAQGESTGAPAPLEVVAEQVHDLLVSLRVERPIMVGHSMSGGIAAEYALAHPAAGIVLVDNGRRSAHLPICSNGWSRRCVAPASRMSGRSSRQASGSSASPSRCARLCSTPTR